MPTISSKVGRNDHCPCGSGLKYKKCHLGRTLPVFPEPYKGVSIRERNLTLIDAVSEIFLNGCNDWQAVKNSITEDKVRELYKVIAYLWPPQTNIEPLLPKPGSTLRGLYTGQTKPQTILQNIVRYSLYTDEILVVSPFQTPHVLRSEFNPIINPKPYRQDTLELVYFVTALAPWIVSGTVNMIPDPMDFDFRLRKELYAMGEKRYSDNESYYDKKIKEEVDTKGLDDFKKLMLRMPVELLRKKLLEYKPKSSEQDIEQLVKYILAERKKDPFLLDEELGDPELRITRMSAGLELGMYLAQITGSYLYTDSKLQWDDILATGRNTTESESIWSPLTKAFQDLDFKFLNDVDPKFAYRLQEEGRLKTFRNYLRRVWLKVGINHSGSGYSDGVIREFVDELNEEFAKSKEDWNKIDQNIVKWMTGATGVSSLLPIITGGLNWSMLTFAISGVGTLLNSRYERKRFKANVPLSVFIDLEKKNTAFK